jgi:hypothetical protein
MSKGFDGYAPINPQAAKDAGAIAVSGYLVGNVPMTREWVESCTTVGIGIWSAWELAANAPENGAEQGVQDATAAVAAARALGQPTGTAIYFTNDSEVTNQNAVIAYFHAVAQIVNAAGYKPGLYGQTVVQEWINFPYFWHAPDGTNPPWPGQITQSGKEVLSSGETVDVDTITADDFGAWNADGKFSSSTEPTTPTTPNIPAPTTAQPTEDSMFLIHLADPENAPNHTEWWLLNGGRLSPVSGLDLANLNNDEPTLQRMNGATHWATLSGFIAP